MPSLFDLLTGKAGNRSTQESDDRDCEIEEQRAKNDELRKESMGAIEEALAVHTRLQQRRGFPVADAVRWRNGG